MNWLPGGAIGYGGGIQSSVLPGIGGGGTVAPDFGGSGIFGGSAGSGSLTNAGGMFGTNGGNLFGSPGMSPMAQLGLAQGIGNLFTAGSPQLSTPNLSLPAPQALLSAGPSRPQMLAAALNRFQGV